MVADFTITIHDVLKPLGVRVVVHDNLRAMRSAVTQQERLWYGRNKRRKKFDTKGLMGVCQRFHMEDSSTYAIVRLAVPEVGAGMVAHELTHAAVWLWEIKHQFEPTPISNEHDDEEWFAWILGELVRQTTVKFHELGVYDHGA